MLKKLIFVSITFSGIASVDAASPATTAPSTSTIQNSSLKKGHPEATLSILSPYIKTDASILDLGNGTGVGARQLCKNGFHTVIGVEPNSAMIKAAEEGRTEGMCTVKYLEGSVKKGLQFPENKFDLVTAFTGFHWYADPASIKEVSRVLKPNGYFFIARGLLKNSDPVRAKITQIIEEETGQKVANPDLQATKLLEQQGFKIVLDTSVPLTEYFTKTEYLNYLHSYDAWDMALKSSKINAIQKKVDQYLNTLVDANGIIKIELKAPIILAQKINR